MDASIPDALRRILPPDIDPERISELVFLSASLSGELGETWLLRHADRIVALTRRSPFQPPEVIHFPPEMEHRMERGGFEQVLILPAGKTTYRVQVSSPEADRIDIFFDPRQRVATVVPDAVAGQPARPEDSTALTREAAAGAASGWDRVLSGVKGAAHSVAQKTSDYAGEKMEHSIDRMLDLMEMAARRAAHREAVRDLRITAKLDLGLGEIGFEATYDRKELARMARAADKSDRT